LFDIKDDFDYDDIIIEAEDDKKPTTSHPYS
jgi:hypothetical protein